MYKTAHRFLAKNPGCRALISSEHQGQFPDRFVMVAFLRRRTNQGLETVFRYEFSFATHRYAEKKFASSNFPYVELHIDGKLGEKRGNPTLKLEWEQINKK